MQENAYAATLKALLEQMHPTLGTTHPIEFKNCFGAVAGYVHGHIFISCGTFGIALRLPPKTLETLFKETDVVHLKYFPQGHIKKEYAVLPKRMLQDAQRCSMLIDESLAYASSQIAHHTKVEITYKGKK